MGPIALLVYPMPVSSTPFKYLNSLARPAERTAFLRTVDEAVC
jgi:hypothetical protein